MLHRRFLIYFASTFLSYPCFLSNLIWLPSGIGGAADGSKCRFEVLNDGNFFEVCSNYSKHILSAHLLYDFVVRTKFLIQDSKIAGFKAAVVPAQTMLCQIIESRSLVDVLRAVFTNIIECSTWYRNLHID